MTLCIFNIININKEVKYLSIKWKRQIISWWSRCSSTWAFR